MLTRLRIKNFKRFPDADIELGQAVVFIGQNNSGKTTALQALALWDVGLRKWNEEYKGKTAPAQRPGVTINRRDLLAIPVPGANLLLRNLHVCSTSPAPAADCSRHFSCSLICTPTRGPFFCSTSPTRIWKSSASAKSTNSSPRSPLARARKSSPPAIPKSCSTKPPTAISSSPSSARLTAWTTVVSKSLRPSRISASTSIYQAELTGWALYLEGSTDLAILQAFANTLKHPAAAVLERPFVHYLTTNLPNRAREHFCGLQEAKPDLVGFALFDRIDKPLASGTPLTETMWRKREIENYLCQESVLLAFARHDQPDDLFGRAEAGRREQLMRACIQEIISALQTLGRPGLWSADVKASDDFLNPLFDRFFQKLELPNLLRKTDYHALARLVPADKIDPEITAKLDGIVAVAAKASPRAAP